MTSGGPVTQTRASTMADVLRLATRRCKRGIAVAAGFSLFVNLLMLTAPIYMLQVFDRVLTSRSYETLLYLTIIAIVAFVVYGVLDVVRNEVMDRVGSWFDAFLSGDVLKSGVVQALGRTSVKSVQGLRDLSTIRSFLTGPSVFPLMDMPWTPIFLLAIFILHPVLGWLSATGAVVLLALALLNEFVTKRKLAEADRESINSLHMADAAVRGSDTVQSMGMLPAIVGRWKKAKLDVLSKSSQANRRGGILRSVVRGIRLSMQVAVLGVGAWLVLGGSLTPGGMIAASILMARALAPIDQSIASWRSGIGAREALGRLKQQLNEEQKLQEGTPLPRPEGRIEVDNISFVTETSNHPILNKISFEIAAGNSVGVVGPTAAGKTTLVRMLVGTLQPSVGHVRLDGMDIAEWNADDRGRHVGYLAQDVHLFDATVSENIARLGQPDPDAVMEAARLANAHEMILRLPQGYDTRLGDGGGLLSGGQKQRIGLARAVYGKPSFVVLDEPSSNLDQEGESALVATLAELKKMGTTIVIVAHRPNILRMVDKILVIAEGEARLFGDRDDVLARISPPQGIRPAPAPAQNTTSQ